MNRLTFSTLALTLGASGFIQAETSYNETKPAYDFPQAVSERLDLFNTSRYGVENRWIQDFRIKLRAQYQYGYIAPAGGESREKGGPEHGRNTNSEWRRFRIAAQAQVLHRFTIVSNWNIGGGLEGRARHSHG